MLAYLFGSTVRAVMSCTAACGFNGKGEDMDMGPASNLGGARGMHSRSGQMEKTSQ